MESDPMFYWQEFFEEALVGSNTKKLNIKMNLKSLFKVGERRKLIWKEENMIFSSWKKK